MNVEQSDDAEKTQQLDFFAYESVDLIF